MIAVIIPAPAQIPAPDPATVITGALVSAVAVIPLLSVVGGLALILTRWVSDQHTPVPAPARRRLLLAVSAWGAATVVSTCIATQNGFSTPGGVLLAALALWSVYASARTGYLLCAARQENQGLLHLQGAPPATRCSCGARRRRRVAASRSRAVEATPPGTVLPTPIVTSGRRVLPPRDLPCGPGASDGPRTP